MTQPHIVVHNLSKTYRVPEREPGLAASLKSLVKRTTRDVEAVRSVGFTVEAGEMVGFSAPTARARRPRSRCYPGCCTRRQVRRRCWDSPPGSASPCIYGRLAW